MTRKEIACKLGTDELAAQAGRWAALRKQAETAREETGDGLRLHFVAGRGVEEQLRALAAVESRCCAWARWEVVSTPDGLVLEVDSPGDGAAVLHGMFG